MKHRFPFLLALGAFLLSCSILPGCASRTEKLTHAELRLGEVFAGGNKDTTIESAHLTKSGTNIDLTITGYKSVADAAALNASTQQAQMLTQLLGGLQTQLQSMAQMAGAAYGVRLPPIPINNPPLFVPLPPVSATNSEAVPK